MPQSFSTIDCRGPVIDSTAALARSAKDFVGFAAGAGTISAGSAEASCTGASARLALAASAIFSVILTGPCGLSASATFAIRVGFVVSLASATFVAGASAALTALDSTPWVAAAAKRSLNISREIGVTTCTRSGSSAKTSLTASPASRSATLGARLITGSS